MVAVLPAVTSAQGPISPELGGKVQSGDKIFVTDRQGRQTGGRFLRASVEELVLGEGAHEIMIPLSTIGRVEKRDSVWNGMLIGAAPSALVGMGAAGASCSPHCGRDVTVGALVFGGIGAGIGALVDSTIPGYSIVDGPPLASPNALGTPEPVPSLDELWLRVRQGDRVEVVTVSGSKVVGTFVEVSKTSVTLKVDGDRREIASTDVRRVTRTGNRYRSGALWGGMAFGAIGLIGSAACNGNTSQCGNPLFVAMFLGGGGAIWGTAIGALIPKHAAIYQTGSSSAFHVMPMIAPGRVGVTGLVKF